MYAEDEKILLAIKNEDKVKMKAFYLTEKSPFISFLQKKFSLDEETAGTLYQDSYTDMFVNIRAGKLQAPLKASLKTYLFSIGKYKSLNYLRNRVSTTSKNEFPEIPIEPEVERSLELKEKGRMVKMLLQKIGEPCRRLLTLLYIEEKDYEETGSILGIEKAGTLRKRKFDCLKKIRTFI